MFTNDAIQDNLATFGYFATIDIYTAKFKRMGKSGIMSLKMARELVNSYIQF